MLYIARFAMIGVFIEGLECMGISSFIAQCVITILSFVVFEALVVMEYHNNG